MVPTNVEKYLMTHPAVVDAAVVGLPHEVDGERPMAFVVLSPDLHATVDELIAYTSGKRNKIIRIENALYSIEFLFFEFDRESYGRGTIAGWSPFHRQNSTKRPGENNASGTY